MTPLFDILAVPKAVTVKEFYYPALFDTLPSAKVFYDGAPAGDKCLRYLLLLYDRYSPLRAKYPDIKKRKIEAGRLSHFATGKNSPDQEVLQDLYRLGSSAYIDLIIELSQVQQSREWDIITVNSENFYECQRILLTPITEAGNDLIKGAELKGKLRDQIIKIHETLEHYYLVLFPDEVGLQNPARGKRPLSPENIGSGI